jgi:competence protein ComEC
VTSVSPRIGEQFYDDRESHILWLPVFFIGGIFLRFGCCIAITLVVSVLLTSLATLIVFRNYLIKAVAAMVLFVALGFLRTDRRIAKYDFPVIKYNLGKVVVYGNVADEMVSFSKNSGPIKYIVVDVDRIEAINEDSTFANDRHFKNPRKVRIKLLDPKEKITYGYSAIETILMPIDRKKFDSDFDFQLHFYFNQIGGVGYRGIIKNVDYDHNFPHKKTFISKLNRFRFTMAKRIMSIRRGFSTGIIATVITGQKNLNDEKLLKLINFSGIAHIMSISGIHFVIISQLVLLLVKNILYEFRKINPTFYVPNVYKVSAVISMAANFVYLLIGGFSLSSLRAYIMSLVNGGSVLLDRFNSPLRSLMFTMLSMIFFRPELVLTSGFYMSFITPMVIVAFMEYYYIHRNCNDDQSHNNAIMSLEKLKVGFFVSISIELVLAPIEMYSFNVFNPYRILVSSLVNPLMTYLVIPLSLASLLLYPLRLESLLVYPLSFVVDLIVLIAKFFSRLPKSAIAVQSPATTLVFLALAGILWVSLWSQRWRIFGFIIYALAIAMMIFERRPEVIVDGVGKMIIFLDEKQDIYVYKPKKYHMENIMKKLGKNSYFDLEDRRPNSCTGNYSKNCCEIRLQRDSIVFRRGGGEVVISTGGKYFSVKRKSGNIGLKIIEDHRGRTRPRKCGGKM